MGRSSVSISQETLVTDDGVVISSSQVGTSTALDVAILYGNVTAAFSGNITAVISGTVTTKEARSSTGTLSSQVGTTTGVVLLATNANRLGATISFTASISTTVLFMALSSSTASTTSYTLPVAAGGYYEVPYNYTGPISGIFSAANGTALITELS